MRRLALSILCILVSTTAAICAITVAAESVTTYADKWRTEVEWTRLDPPSIGPSLVPEFTPTPSPSVYLSISGTVTNITKKPVTGDPTLGLHALDDDYRTFAPATEPDPTQEYFPTFNPSIPTPFMVAFLVPIDATGFRLVSEDESLDIELPVPTISTTDDAIQEPTLDTSYAFRLGPPVMAGELGDGWDLELGDDSSWWEATDFYWVERPASRWIAEPRYGWFVVTMDVGTMDGWLFTDFPYESFVLEDSQGNVYYPDLIATAAFCDAYCDMDIQQQDFSGWVGYAFHQAIVFDVPRSAPYDADDSGYTLRTLDGLIAVPIRQDP